MVLLFVLGFEGALGPTYFQHIDCTIKGCTVPTFPRCSLALEPETISLMLKMSYKSQLCCRVPLSVQNHATRPPFFLIVQCLRRAKRWPLGVLVSSLARARQPALARVLVVPHSSHTYDHYSNDVHCAPENLLCFGNFFLAFVGIYAACRRTTKN